ncbi:MAG TPA: cytochrome c oxidase assembly protein [Actinomycetota bacterium]
MVAHAGVPGSFTLKTLVTGWAFEPVPLALIVVAGFLYWAGLRRLSGPPVWRGGRTWSWYGGLAAALVAVASPIDTYADVSFSTHMVQHVLLLFVAAPLFALGAPVTLALRASRPATRRRFLLPVLHSRVVRVLTHPLVAVALFMGTQFVTHLTGFYEAALTSSIVHDLEHALYLTTALLFWWPVVGLDPAPNKMSHPARIVYLVLMMPLEAFLALAILSGHAYPHYLALPPPWGGTNAVNDLSSAGALMWISGDLSALIAGLLVAGAWLRHDQIRQRRIEEDEDRRSAILDSAD